MSCIEISVSRIGDLKAEASRFGVTELSAERIGGLEAEATRVRGIRCVVNRISDFTVRVGLVCGTNFGSYGIIWASEGKLITIENGYLIQA